MESAQFSPLTPKTVLAVTAHPDDIDVTAAGTMARFASQGAAVHYLVLTNGSKGTADSQLDADTLTHIRHQEQQAALQTIGGTGFDQLGYDDGQLEVTMQLKKEIVRAIRTLSPEVVITFDPSVYYVSEQGLINHPDHRAAGQAAMDAVFPLARDHLSFPELREEGLQAHKVATLLLINQTEHNFYVDISHHLEQKLQAVAAHSSQFPDITALQERLRLVASRHGAKIGSQYAETFVRIDIQPH